MVDISENNIYQKLYNVWVNTYEVTLFKRFDLQPCCTVLIDKTWVQWILLVEKFRTLHFAMIGIESRFCGTVINVAF